MLLPSMGVLVALIDVVVVEVVVGDVVSADQNRMIGNWDKVMVD